MRVHDGGELVPVDLSVVVGVRLAEVHQLVELGEAHVVADGFGRGGYVLEDDEPFPGDVEAIEPDVQRGVARHLRDALSHLTDELAEVHAAAAVLVEGVEHRLEFLLVGLKAERSSRGFEFIFVDVAAVVGVDEVERLGQFLDELSLHAVIINHESLVVIVGIVIAGIVVLLDNLRLFRVLLRRGSRPLRGGPREAPRKRIPTHRHRPPVQQQLLQRTGQRLDVGALEDGADDGVGGDSLHGDGAPPRHRGVARLLLCERRVTPARSDALGDERTGAGHPTRDLYLARYDEADVAVLLVQRTEPRGGGFLLALHLQQHRGLLELVDPESIRLAPGHGKPLALGEPRDGE